MGRRRERRISWQIWSRSFLSVRGPPGTAAARPPAGRIAILELSALGEPTTSPLVPPNQMASRAACQKSLACDWISPHYQPWLSLPPATTLFGHLQSADSPFAKAPDPYAVTTFILLKIRNLCTLPTCARGTLIAGLCRGANHRLPAHPWDTKRT